MDILQREGNYPAPAGCTQIMGVEFSGHIAALGDGVSGDWRVGDEIMGLAGGVNIRFLSLSCRIATVFCNNC